MIWLTLKSLFYEFIFINQKERKVIFGKYLYNRSFNVNIAL